MKLGNITGTLKEGTVKQILRVGRFQVRVAKGNASAGYGIRTLNVPASLGKRLYIVIGKVGICFTILAKEENQK